MTTPAQVVTGRWYALQAIFQHQKEEFDAWAQIVETEGGMACPVCGEPLSTGPASAAGEVTRYCRFAGDHSFRAPNDVVRPVPGVNMGRYG
jgi:hypothetical protein